MTLAEAKQLSAKQLAERLLGAAGMAGGYVEAKIQGNGGLMIAAPGLNSVDLYRRPRSAGFGGLCQIEGVHVQFSASRGSTGDPPHRVENFWKFIRYAKVNAGGEDRACARLAPVVGRTDPTLFSVSGDKAAAASFALKALAKAQQRADSFNQVGCVSHDASWPICSNPADALRQVPITQIHYMKVERCVDGAEWCVAATWFASRSGNETKELEISIRTSARQIDPPVDFTVVSVALDAGTSIDD